MVGRLLVPQAVLDETFFHFRTCGAGHRECQVVWVSSWDSPEQISNAVHPRHKAHMAGLTVDDAWLTEFWKELRRTNIGIRVQIHTHPGAAFHSATDDAYPMISTVGFLSLVIPRFGLGPVGFDRAFLAELQADGRFLEVPIADGLVVQ